MQDVGEMVPVAQEAVRQDLRGMFHGAIRASLELFLEAELEALVGAEWYARVAGRRDRRNGAYTRRLLTSAYVNGVSHRKAGELTEALLGERVSRSTVSRVTKQLDARVEALQRTPIEGEHPYLYLDATFVDARWARTVENVSALMAYAVGPTGHRQLLGVALGVEESEANWAELLEQLGDRGLTGVQLVIADEHAGLGAAVRKWLPEVKRQRCTVDSVTPAWSAA